MIFDLRKTIFGLGVVLTIFGGIGTVQASMLLFSSEDPEEQSNEFILDIANDYDVYGIRFGQDIAASIVFDQLEDKFEINEDVDLGGNELQNFKIENLAVAPACTATDEGRIYFNTTDSHTYACQNLVWSRLDQAGIETDSTEQTTDYDTLAINTIKVLSSTSANRPADKVYIVKTLGDANVKTQVATTTNERYFRTFQASVWSGWSKIKTKKYANYTVGDIDQTDGTASYIGRTRDSDAKWLITRSDNAGFTYAQIENNGGTSDIATAWTNRLTLTYGPTFTP